jgi:hypothetical protein
MALVAFLSGCQKTGLTEDDCQQIITPMERSECLWNLSMTLRNPVHCKDIPNLTMRVDCIDALAVQLRQEYYCIHHNRLQAKENCEYLVAMAHRRDRETGKTQETGG